MVWGASEGKTKGLYHSSSYAAMKDAEWVEFKKAAIVESNARMTKMQKDVDKLGF